MMNKIILLVSALNLFTIVNAQVLDTDGNRVQTNTNYYILPVARGMGGGLGPASRNNTCPLYVAQAQMEVSNGLSLKFFPVDSNAKFVELLTDMNIRFSGANTCVQSMTWKLGGVDGVTGRRYVRFGGVIGNPGAGTLSNWFRIESFGKNDYKIVFCPSVCSTCRPQCGNLGVFIEGGRRWLGLGDTPLRVMFKKA